MKAAQYNIRPVNFDTIEEVNTIAAFSILTIFETLPEARQQPTLVPNLSIDAMVSMYLKNRDNPEHRFLVITDKDGTLVGHAIGLLRTDGENVRHGYSYTRYILPAHRRRGLARLLLREVLQWWKDHKAAYILAHTHPTNTALLGLFTSEGFEVIGETHKRWRALTLRRSSNPTA